jgi:hypothetical protein
LNDEHAAKKKEQKSSSPSLVATVPALAGLMSLDQKLILLTVQHPGEGDDEDDDDCEDDGGDTVQVKGAIGREVPLVGPNLKLGKGTEHDVVVLCRQLVEEEKEGEERRRKRKRRWLAIAWRKRVR